MDVSIIDPADNKKDNNAISLVNNCSIDKSVINVKNNSL